jgi:hypothetical protein
MAERKPDPPVLRASIVDSGWEPEQPKERELPRYDDPARELLVTRVDDQVQARAAAMNEEARASAADLTVPDGTAPASLVGPADERTVVDKALPFNSSEPPPHLSPTFDEPAPSLGEALRMRVRVAGGEVPLFATIVPVLALGALFAALLGGLLGSAGSRAPAPDAAAASSGAALTAASASAPSATAAATGVGAEPPPSPSGHALALLEQKKPGELGTEEVLTLANGKAEKAMASARGLADRLAGDPGLAKNPAVLSELRAFAAAPETARVALAAMARLPGPLSADLLYEVWTGTAEKSESTELARALLLGQDVRPKASPALAVALELRQAEGCEAQQPLIVRATELGDKRSLAPLAKLLRRTGCGPAKRDDCYPCLRDGDALKNAIIAVKKRREPDLGKR